MNQSPLHTTMLQRIGDFAPLEQADFQRLQHAASLKAFLKPFKGKSDVEALATDCVRLRDDLILLAQRIVAQATRHPFDLLPASLSLQTTGAGTAFLRWRNSDRSAMGVWLWTQLMEQQNTPAPLARALFDLELQRLTLNMQISLVHSVARQARECASKLATAEATYRDRFPPSSR